jgi:hypothetical protein
LCALTFSDPDQLPKVELGTKLLLRVSHESSAPRRFGAAAFSGLAIKE